MKGLRELSEDLDRLGKVLCESAEDDAADEGDDRDGVLIAEAAEGEAAEAFAQLTAALAHTKLPTSDGKKRTADADEFMFMPLLGHYGAGEAKHWAFKHSTTRNYVMVDRKTGKLTIPSSGKPFMKGVFDETPEPTVAGEKVSQAVLDDWVRVVEAKIGKLPGRAGGLQDLIAMSPKAATTMATLREGLRAAVVVAALEAGMELPPVERQAVRAFATKAKGL